MLEQLFLALLKQLFTQQQQLTTHQLKVALLFVVVKVVTAEHHLMAPSSGKVVHVAVVDLTPNVLKVIVMIVGMQTFVKKDVHHAQQQCAVRDLRLNARIMDLVIAEVMVPVLL